MPKRRFKAVPILLTVLLVEVMSSTMAVSQEKTSGPTTINGEKALPLRVPPPAKLLPLIAPKLPKGTIPIVPTSKPITLTQAIQIGLQHQPQLMIAKQTLNAAAGRTIQAASQLYPTVSVSSSYSRSDIAQPGFGGGASGTGLPPDSFNSSVSVQQLLYDFNRTGNNLHAARFQETSDRAALDQALQDTVYNVTNAYLTLLEDHQLVQVDHQTVASQQGHLDEARAQFNAGTVPQSDVVQAQANLAQALLTLSTDQNSEALSRTNLNLAMGIDPRTPIKVVEVPTETVNLPPLNQLITQALATRPQVLQAEAQVKSNEASLRSSRTGNLPSLYATGSYSAVGSEFPGTTIDRVGGVRLSWDFFDSGSTKGQIKQAEANLSSARSQLVLTQQQTINEVSQAYINVTNDQQRIITSTAEVANAQESLRLTEGQYRAGVGIFLQVEDAQAALATAEANQINASYGLSIALAALHHAIGEALGP